MYGYLLYDYLTIMTDYMLYDYLLDPGMSGHYLLDAQTFAEWGVDYVKIDGCYYDPEDSQKLFQEFGSALNSTGRPIVYSCEWPYYERLTGKTV